MPPTGRSQLEQLRCRINKVKPFLEMDGTWYFSDVGVDNESHADVLQMMIDSGALIIVGRVRYDDESKAKNEYRWDQDIKEVLKRYWDSLEKLPCGHRAHIYHDRDLPDDTYGCRFCDNMGIEQRYSREVIKEAMGA
jgi:hypothetical protein